MKHYGAVEDSETSAEIFQSHFCAVTANHSEAIDLGFSGDHIFATWNWVNTIFSVSSAAGILPLSIVFGYSQIELFLDGLKSVDTHFETSPLESNLPVLLALIGWYNTYITGKSFRAVIPYSLALSNGFPAHI